MVQAPYQARQAAIPASMSNRVDSGVDSGSGGNFLILFGHILIVRAVQHENLLIDNLSIKFSKFSPLPEPTPESALLDMRGDGTTPPLLCTHYPTLMSAKCSHRPDAHHIFEMFRFWEITPVP